MRVLRVLSLCVIAFLWGGCAGLRGTDPIPDRQSNLRDAAELYEHEDRPVFAERLIRETLDAYAKSDDELGLAESYRAYAYFLRSQAVESKRQYFRENGFLDPTVSFETRYERSIDYLDKAREIYERYGRFDALTNINLNIGFTYEVLGNAEAACRAFDRSLENNRDGLEHNARVKLGLPKGFASYEEFLAPHRQRVGCDTLHKHRGKQRRVMSA